MSITQKNDENLLILSEDSDTLDFGISEEQLKKTTDNDDFSFTIEEEKEPVVLEEENLLNNSNKINSSENLTKDSLNDLMSDLTPKNKIEETKEENSLLDFNVEESKKEESNLETKTEGTLDLGGFDLLSDEKTEENINKIEQKSEDIFNFTDTKEERSSSSSTKEVGDMSEILGRTISEFTERENLIDEDIIEKEAHILALEKELNTEKDIVFDLKSEKTAIEKNRKSPEKMKTDFENREDEKNLTIKKTTQK